MVAQSSPLKCTFATWHLDTALTNLGGEDCSRRLAPRFKRRPELHPHEEGGATQGYGGHHPQRHPSSNPVGDFTCMPAKPPMKATKERNHAMQDVVLAHGGALADHSTALAPKLEANGHHFEICVRFALPCSQRTAKLFSHPPTI